MTAALVSLPFRVGVWAVWTVRRPLWRVAWSLDDALRPKSAKVLRAGGSGQGWLVTSVPETELDQLVRTGFFLAVRQRYVRSYTDLGGTYEEWLAGLSGNARSGLRRKLKKLAQHPDKMEVRAFRGAAELREFHRLARPLAARTYQERLLGMGLPDGTAFLAEQDALAAEDRVRAWLMTLGGRSIAYLWCSAEGESLRYDYVGHDPDHAELSPGTVLHAHAFADLFAEGRFARFDFTEGEGQHKRQFATGGVACADVLVLPDTVANRLLAGALRGFDSGVAAAKRLRARVGRATSRPCTSGRKPSSSPPASMASTGPLRGR